MAKKHKKSKKNIISRKRILNANIRRWELFVAMFFAITTLICTFISIRVEHVSILDGFAIISEPIVQLTLANAIILLTLSISGLFEDNNPARKGIVSTLGLCSINLLGGSVNKNEEFEYLCGFFHHLRTDTVTINNLTHLVVLFGTVVFIVSITLLFCKKIR